jgi:hypothetical protein
VGSRPQSHGFRLLGSILIREAHCESSGEDLKSLYAYPMGRHNLDLAADPQRQNRSVVVAQPSRGTTGLVPVKGYLLVTGL